MTSATPCETAHRRLGRSPSRAAAAAARSPRFCERFDLHDREPRSADPSPSILKPDLLLAAAWVEAARGGVSHAVANARQAAEFAQTHGQLAREVMSLQTARHFGDKTTVARLRELKEHVEGPRAPAAFEFAAALAVGSGAALSLDPLTNRLFVGVSG